MKNQARIIQLLNRVGNMLKIEIEEARTDQDKDAIKRLDKLYNLVKKIEVKTLQSSKENRSQSLSTGALEKLWKKI